MSAAWPAYYIELRFTLVIFNSSYPLFTDWAHFTDLPRTVTWVKQSQLAQESGEWKPDFSREIRRLYNHWATQTDWPHTVAYSTETITVVGSECWVSSWVVPTLYSSMIHIYHVTSFTMLISFRWAWRHILKCFPPTHRISNSYTCRVPGTNEGKNNHRVTYMHQQEYKTFINYLSKTKWKCLHHLPFVVSQSPTWDIKRDLAQSVARLL